MKRNIFLVVVFLFVLSGVSSLDEESLIGLVGDGQARGSYFGDIETAFEGIVDDEGPLIEFVSPTRADGNVTSDTSIEINVTIEEANLDEVKFNWDGTNYTMYDDSLVLMYNFDNVSALGENDTFVVDVSGNGNDGDGNNFDLDEVTCSDAVYGCSYDLDGTNDYIDMGNDPSLNFGVDTSFTISLWIKTTQTISDPPMISNKNWASGGNPGYVIHLQGNVCRINIGDGSNRVDLDGTITVNDNLWHNCIFVVNRGDVTSLYVDGVFDNSRSMSAINNILSPYNHIIGNDGTTNYPQFYDGLIDEVRIWNRGLSTEEVYQQYVSNLKKVDPDSWELYINQSLNATNGLDYGTYTYFASAKDSAGNENLTEVRSLTIENSLPTVTLISPSDWNSTMDRSPAFTWSGYDLEGDSLTYEISIGEHKYSGVKICNDDISDDTLTSESYIPTSDLLCLYDNGYYYNWSVRAHDGIGWGAWSDVWHFNVTAEVSISLASSEVSFGSMTPGDSLNTSDDSPTPFVIDNDGNVVVNVSLNSSALWDEAPTDSSYFQFKVDSTPAELGTFNLLSSIINWFNMPITGNVVAIAELKYAEGDDSAEVDIKLEVPENEAPGVKSATIVFTGALAE